MTARMDEMMRDCIDECSSCHDVCMETMAHAVETGGKLTASPHVLLLADCAEICQTSADFMLRGSDEHARICAACAALCQRCAEDCDQFAGDDVMHACAEACRGCADSCEAMAAARA